VEEFARVLLALLVVALAVNLVQGGPKQTWGWLAAKFLGRTYGGS
jgi:hypothetical protein